MDQTRPKTRVHKQQRTLKTRERIREAGLRLFGRDGFHGTNVKKIVSEAGLSVGSFYTYFKDKKDLFLELVEQHNKQQIERAFHPQNGALKKVLKKEALQGIIKMVLAYHNLDPEFNREIEAMRYLDEDVNRTQEKQDEIVVRYLTSALEAAGDEVRIRDAEAAARIVRITIISNVHSMSMLGSKIEEDRLINELVDMVQRYFFHLMV